MATFDMALQVQLERLAKPTSQQQNLLHILGSPDSLRRRRQVEHMERATRNRLGIHPSEQVDWSKIDWRSVLSIVLDVLVAILPFLLAL